MLLSLIVPAAWALVPVIAVETAFARLGIELRLKHLQKLLRAALLRGRRGGRGAGFLRACDGLQLRCVQRIAAKGGVNRGVNQLARLNSTREGAAELKSIQTASFMQP